MWRPDAPTPESPRLQGVGEGLAGVVALGHFRVGEYQLFIEHMELVFHLLLAILVPGVDHASFRVPHMEDANVAVKARAVFFCVSVQLTVDQVDRVLFISRPHTPFVNPDCIEVAASDHEVATFLDDKLGIDLDDAAFPAAR